MHITKVNDSYDDYKMELSWSELKAIEGALSQHHVGAIADETYARLKFYMPRLPGPGQEKEKGDGQTLEQTRAKEELAASRETTPQELLNPDEVPMPPGSSEGAEAGSRGGENFPLPVGSREAEGSPPTHEESATVPAAVRVPARSLVESTSEITVDSIPMPGSRPGSLRRLF